MKFVAILALLVAGSAQAIHIKCAEKAETAVKARRLQYGVWVTTTAPITDKRIIGDADYAEYVRISIVSRDPKVFGSKFKLHRSSFQAIAKSSDVSYWVDAKKSHGFNLHIYMDELDQTSMKIATLSKSIQLNCHSSSHD